MKRALSLLGVVILLGLGFVVWNRVGAGPYGASCRFAFGCKELYCMQHGIAGTAQVTAPGRCTQACDTDAECGAEARCVELGDDARGDFIPLRKLAKACLIVVDKPADVRPRVE